MSRYIIYDKNKEIAKMAIICCKRRQKVKTADDCEKCNFYKCKQWELAAKLYDAGYRNNPYVALAEERDANLRLLGGMSHLVGTLDFEKER